MLEGTSDRHSVLHCTAEHSCVPNTRSAAHIWSTRCVPCATYSEFPLLLYTVVTDLSL